MQFDVKSVIRRIEIRLAEIGMTKQEFYEKSGISSGSFSQWNTGKHAPSIKKVQRAASVIGVTTEYLLYGVALMPDEELVPQEDIKKEATNTGDLSDAELKLIELFRKLPAETQSSFPALLEATLKAQGLL